MNKKIKKIYKIAKKSQEIDLALKNYKNLSTKHSIIKLENLIGNILLESDLNIDNLVLKKFFEEIKKAAFLKREIIFRTFKINWKIIDNIYFPFIDTSINSNSYNSSLYLMPEKQTSWEMAKIVEIFEFYLNQSLNFQYLFELWPGIAIFKDEHNNYKLFYDERIWELNERK